MKVLARELLSGKLFLLSGDFTGGSGAYNPPVPISDISGLQAALDAKVNKSGDIMSGLLTLSGLPTSSLHAAPKSYVDMIAQSLGRPHPACVSSTSGNIALSGLGTQANGYWTAPLSNGDRILVKNQTILANNGIYEARAGSWTRPTDMDVWSEFPNTSVFIQALGSIYEYSTWVCASDIDGTVGVTDAIFIQSSQSKPYFTDGLGIEFDGNILGLELDGISLEKSASGLKVSETTARFSQMLDSNGNIAIKINPAGTAVNYLSLYNSATGLPVILASEGSDTNIPLKFVAKGTGSYILSATGSTTTNPKNITFDLGGAEAGRYEWDGANGSQNTIGNAVQHYSYHTLVLNGNRNTSGRPNFSNKSDVGVYIDGISSFEGATPQFIVDIDVTQTGDIQRWDKAGTTLAKVDANGNISAINLSGTNTGDQTNISGNAATVTTNANLTGPITSVGNATSIASQTGTGTTFVMNTSPVIATPTITTSAIIPIIYGSIAASGNLQLYSTSDAAKGFIYLGDSSGYNGAAICLGIGTQTPNTTGRTVHLYNDNSTSSSSDNSSFIAHSVNRNAVFNSRTSITGTSAFQHQSLDGLTTYGQMLFFDGGSSLHQWALNIDGNQRIAVASDGRVTLGLATSVATDLTVSKNITGSTVGIGIYQKGVVQSDVTAAAYGFRNDLGTQATAFTLAEYNHFLANQPALGAGSAITTQFGFRVNSNLTSATTNYGFYGDIAASTNRWNLYMNGTAQNYLAGKLGINIPVPLTPIHAVSNDSATLGSLILIDCYDATPTPGGFGSRKARGTSSSPTRALTNDNLVFLNGRGYVTDIAAFSTLNNGQLGIYAAEDFATSASTGTFFQLELTPIGSSTRANIFRVTGGSSSTSTSLFGFGASAASAPLAKFDITGDISQAAWTTSGIGLRYRNATFTDTSSSGTVAQVNAHAFGTATIATSSVTTYTDAFGFFLNPPAAGTNVTMSSIWTLGISGSMAFTGGSPKISTTTAAPLTFQTNKTDRLIISATGLVGIGSVAPVTLLTLNGASNTVSSTAWTTSGIGLRVGNNTYTDTTSSGTVAAIHCNVFAQPIFAFSSVTTVTDAYNVRINNPVAAGANGTIINTWALGIVGNTEMTGDIVMLGATRAIGTGDSNILQFKTAATVRAFFNPTGNGFTIGTASIATAPNLAISVSARTSTAWTTTGIGIVQAACTYTDTTSSGTVAVISCNVFNSPTFAFSSVTTVTDAYATRLNSVTAGTNATFTNNWALGVVGNTEMQGDLAFTGATRGIGTLDANILNIRTNNATRIAIQSNGTQAYVQSIASTGSTAFMAYTQANHTGGSKPGFVWTAGTLTGQTASTEIVDINHNLSATKTWATGGITTQRDFLIQPRTYAAIGASAITDAATLEVGTITAGANVTITRNWNTRFTGTGFVGIGGRLYIGDSNVATAPTASLTLAAGTASVAPIELAAGTNLSSIRNGSLEYDGTNYFVSQGGVRYTLAKTLTTTAVLDFPNTAAGTSSDLTVTLTGAALNDIVDVGVPNGSSTGNGTFSAWVSAADTITVRFMNNSLLAAINPASGTFRVAITKY